MSGKHSARRLCVGSPSPAKPSLGSSFHKPENTPRLMRSLETAGLAEAFCAVSPTVKYLVASISNPRDFTRRKRFLALLRPSYPRVDRTA